LRTVALALAPLFALALGFLSCDTKKQTATVQGDVYLVTQSGDVKRAAGNTVRLLAESDSLHLAIARACSTFATDGAEMYARSQWFNRQSRQALNNNDLDRSAKLTDAWGKLLEDSLPSLRARSRLRIDSILLQRAVAEAPTGVNAHYRFAEITAGKYVLWTETMIGDNHYTWWAPIVISAGDSLTRDLDNSTEVDASLHCPPLPHLETK